MGQQKVSDKLQCWVTTNKKEREETIATNENIISETAAAITALTAQKEELTVRSEALTKSIAEDENDLANAEEQRQKATDEFRKFEGDTTKAIGQLSSAITILKKHQGLVQMSKSDRADLRALVSKASEKYAMALDSADVANAKSFLQADPHSSASGQIFGVLGAMKDQMEADLASRQKDDAQARENFKKMREAKTEEIREGRRELSKTDEELA